MMHRARALAALLLLAAAAGCDLVGPGDDARLTLRTGAARYTRAADGAAQVDFTAAARGGTVRVPRCGEAVAPAVERYVGEQWQGYAGGVCIAVLPMDPAEIRAGESRAGTVAIAEAGRFRLRLARMSAGGTADGSAVSPGFIVE